MKKILIAVAAAIPFLAVAENEVMSANTFGVLRLNPSTTVTPITANFGSVEVDGNAPIVVSNLLKTTNLTLGDRLFVYNTSGENWNAYQLAEDGSGNRYWNACDVSNVSPDGFSSISASAPAFGSTINVGQGVFLVRQSTTNPFYAFGQVQTGVVVTAISAGANLIGAPFGTNYNFAAAGLYTDAACTESYTPRAPTRESPGMTITDNGVTITIPPTKASAGDKLVAIASDGAQTEYRYNGSAWVNNNTNVAGTPEIPAGIGFWYFKDNTNDHIDTVYIKWGENN